MNDEVNAAVPVAVCEVTHVERCTVLKTTPADKFNEIPSANSYILEMSDYVTIVLDNVRSNCKVWSVDYVTRMLDGTPDQNEADLERLNKFINTKICTLAFTVTVTQKSHITKLATKFKLAGVSKIPIGYGTKYQYHATFMTNYEAYYGYHTYMNRANEVNIFEFDDVFTDEVVTELMRYTSPYWLKTFLKKLLKTI